MFMGFVVAMAVASQIPQFHEMFNGSSEPLGVMLAAAVMFAVGALDDLRDVSPPAKIAGMVLAGGVLSLFGVQMLFFRVPFLLNDTVVLSADLAPVVTVLMVVLFANAINLIDGLDGLAAGAAVDLGQAGDLDATAGEDAAAQLGDGGRVVGFDEAVRKIHAPVLQGDFGDLNGHGHSGG